MRWATSGQSVLGGKPPIRVLSGEEYRPFVALHHTFLPLIHRYGAATRLCQRNKCKYYAVNI